jgi:hypothetical protein
MKTTLATLLTILIVTVAATPLVAQTSPPTSLTPGAASAPGPNLTSSPVSLQWGTVAGATSYEVQVERFDTWGWSSAGVSSTLTANWSYAPQLFGQDYRFRVRAWDGAAWSAFSAESYFHLDPPAVGGGTGPATPAGLTPGADSGAGPTISNSPITLAFEEPAGATVYEIATEYDASGTWTADQSFQIAQCQFSYNPASWFSTNRWRVRAGNASGWSAWSGYKHFTPGSSTGAANMTVTPAVDLNSSGSPGGPFSPASQTYVVTNTGTASSIFFTSATASWYRVAPSMGTLGAGESRNVSISITSDANGLPAGTYNGSVSFLMFFTSASAVRNVTLSVTGSGLVVTPGSSFTASGPTGGPFAPSSANYQVANTSTGSVNWTATVNQSWVTLSSAGGTLAAGATTSMTATINSGANALTAGSYSATITFTNTSTGAGNTTRTVSLSVSAPGVAGPMTVSPGGGLSSSGAPGGPFSPGSIDYTVTNTGTAPMAWSASSSLGWVALSSTGGTLAAGASTTVTATISGAANSLPAATYNGSIVFNNTTNASGDTTRPVTLAIGAGGGGASISVTPGSDFTATGPVGGPFSPSNQQYSITNNGTADASFTVVADQPWVSVFAPSSTLTPGSGWTTILSFDVSANSLAAGTYTSTVTFTNTTNGVGTTTRVVTLTITGGGGGGASMSVTPATGINASGPVGGPFTSSSQNYVVTNTGTASMNWTASATQGWMTVLPTGGTIAPGGSTTVIVSVNGNAILLAAGSYSDTVTFTNTTNGLGNTTRPVTLTLSGGGGGDTTPPSITIVSPAPPSASTSTNPVTVSGTAGDNVGVTQVTWTNAATGGTGIASGTTSWSASIPLAAGSNLITVTAKDAANNGGSATITIVYTPAGGDTTPPVVTIDTPTTATTATVSSSPVTVGGTAGDNVAVTTVTWFNAATGQSGTASGTTSWTANIALNAGSNTITVSAFDAAGNSSTDAITITLSSTGGGGGGAGTGGGSRNKGGCGGSAGAAGSLLGLVALGLMAAAVARRNR